MGVERSSVPDGKRSWRCPGCNQEYWVRVDADPTICPECRKADVRKRNPNDLPPEAENYVSPRDSAKEGKSETHPVILTNLEQQNASRSGVLSKPIPPSILFLGCLGFAGVTVFVLCCGGLGSVEPDSENVDQAVAIAETDDHEVDLAAVEDRRNQARDARLTRSLRDHLSGFCPGGQFNVSWCDSVERIKVSGHSVDIYMPSVYPDGDAERLAESVTNAVWGWSNQRGSKADILTVSVRARGGKLVSTEWNPLL